MALITAVLQLLMVANCATYKTLISDSKFGTKVLKILTESAHNYLFQDLPQLTEKQRARLRRHKRFLRKLASTRSIRGKARLYKLELLRKNRSATKAIIEPLLTTLEEQAGLHRFENVPKISASTGKRSSSEQFGPTTSPVNTATDSPDTPHFQNYLGADADALTSFTAD